MCDSFDKLCFLQVQWYQHTQERERHLFVYSSVLLLNLKKESWIIMSYFDCRPVFFILHWWVHFLRCFQCATITSINNNNNNNNVDLYSAFQRTRRFTKIINWYKFYSKYNLTKNSTAKFTRTHTRFFPLNWLLSFPFVQFCLLLLLLLVVVVVVVVVVILDNTLIWSMLYFVCCWLYISRFCFFLASFMHVFISKWSDNIKSKHTRS